MSQISEIHNQGEWSKEQVYKSTEDHVMFTWGATDGAREAAVAVKRGEGSYLFDYDGKKYIDLSSQAICNNLGYCAPESIRKAIDKQLVELHHTYSGITINEPRAKLA